MEPPLDPLLELFIMWGYVLVICSKNTNVHPWILGLLPDVLWNYSTYQVRIVSRKAYHNYDSLQERQAHLARV